MKGNFFLLLTAIIWGFAFVAQRVGMDSLGPFSFNGIRFALGAASLLPLLFFGNFSATPKLVSPGCDKTWRSGLIAGLLLFGGGSLQQIGMLYTSAGKAAFITSLYIVLVPLLGIFLHQMPRFNTLLGVLLSGIGLYFLCLKETFHLAYGDLFEICGAFFWAAHILFINRFAGQVETLKLAFLQFSTCSLLSLLAAFCFETLNTTGVLQAAAPLLYGGICSVGIAYTLQIVGQKTADPASAAIILSMETVFAALGGYLILNERLSLTEWTGCLLIFFGMLTAQCHFSILNRPVFHHEHN